MPPSFHGKSEKSINQSPQRLFGMCSLRGIFFQSDILLIA
jgi:hypothetical protein